MAKLQHRTISKRTVDGLSVEEKKDTVFWDRELPGFGVRVYPSGSRVYVVQCRTRGKSKRVTLGRHGVISADQARRKAAVTLARIKGGEAPEPVSSSVVTVAVLAERYLREHVAIHCKTSSGKLYRRALERFVLPAYGHLGVEEGGTGAGIGASLRVAGDTVSGEPCVGDTEQAVQFGGALGVAA